MRFGSTSLKLGSILAKGLRRPKLRLDIRISKQTFAGENTYVINIPESGFYARYSEYEYELLRLCDGSRTVAEVTAALNERHPGERVEEQDVAEFLDGFDPNIWQRTLGEQNLAVLERIREERRKRLERSSLFYIYFSAWNPDMLLQRIHRYLRWMYTRAFVLASLFLFFITAVIVASDWVRIRHDTVAFYSFTNKTAYDIWIFWLLLFFVSGVHEFGHGLTCKHFGGRVPQMGLMLVYFTPAFYTECTDMVMFDRPYKRIWTILAGIWIELVLCGLATLVWYFSPPGSLAGDLGHKTLLLTGVSGIFFNLNPLIKFDGYYMLNEYVQMDSLREDSFDYLKSWVRRTILRQDVDLPAVSRRKRRMFLLYGTGALAYSVLLITVVTVFVKNIFTSKFGGWGYLLTAALLYLILRKYLRRWIPAALSGVREAKEKLMAWRMTRVQKVGSGALLLVLFVAPTAIKVSSDFSLEPAERFEARAAVPGQVVEVRVREGQTVEAGSVLAVLSNPSLDAKVVVLEKELSLAKRMLAGARASGDLGAVQQYDRQRRQVEMELAEATAKQADLTLGSALKGTVITPQLEQRVGDYLEKGEILAEVVDEISMRARILVRDWELEDVVEGAPVRLKLRSSPFRTYGGTVGQIMPAASNERPVAQPEKIERKGQELTNYFVVVLEFPNPSGELREGMTGTAKIYGRRYPIVWRMARSTWRWFRSQVW